MNKTQAQLQPLIAQHVVAGEDCLAAVRVNYNGMSSANTLSSRPGLAGLAGLEGVDMAAAELPPPDPDALVSFPQARQMAIALTGGRLLCWSLGLTGKPKQFLGEVPLTAVEHVGGASGRLGDVLRIRMRSGAEVDLEVLRGEDGVGFTEQLVALVGDGG